MGWVYLSTRHSNKLRKACRCEWCAEAIDVGCPVSRISGVYDGDFITMAFHPECLDARTAMGDKEPDFYEVGYEPGDFARGSCEPKPRVGSAGIPRDLSAGRVAESLPPIP